jgi:hypothetical protein
MRTNKAALHVLSTFASVVSVSANSAITVGTEISAVGRPDDSGASDLAGDKRDGVRSVLIKTKDGEEWPIDVKSVDEVMMKTEDGGEFPVL